MSDFDYYIIGSSNDSVGIDKKQIVLGAKTYALCINTVCEKLLASLDRKTANKILQMRHYRKTYRENQHMGDTVIAFYNKSLSMMHQVERLEQYNNALIPLWNKYIPRIPFDKSFNDYFMCEYGIVDLKAQAQDIIYHIIDLKDAVDIERHKDIVEEAGGINIGEYIVYGLNSNSFTHEILKYYIKFISNE